MVALMIAALDVHSNSVGMAASAIVVFSNRKSRPSRSAIWRASRSRLIVGTETKKSRYQRLVGPVPFTCPGKGAVQLEHCRSEGFRRRDRGRGVRAGTRLPCGEDDGPTITGPMMSSRDTINTVTRCPLPVAR